MKIRKGDTVKILSGKDRGKRGQVSKVFSERDHILVAGINVKKKHRRARRQDRKGEIILIPAPIAASAAQVVCASCGKPTRVGFGRDEQGRKVRRCKKCGKTL